MLTFPIDHGKIFNMVAFREDEGEWADHSKLTKQAHREDALNDFKDFGEDVNKVLRLVKPDLDIVSSNAYLVWKMRFLTIGSGQSSISAITLFQRTINRHCYLSVMPRTPPRRTTAVAPECASKTLPSLQPCFQTSPSGPPKTWKWRLRFTTASDEREEIGWSNRATTAAIATTWSTQRTGRILQSWRRTSAPGTGIFGMWMCRLCASRRASR